MDKDKDILQRIIDNEADEKERDDAAARLEADPGFRDELAGLTKTVSMLRNHGRIDAPFAFTAEVMRKLPAKAPSLAGRIREFLFAGRVLRWNMATALASAVVLIIAAVIVTRAPRQGVNVATQTQTEGIVTVRLTFRGAPQAQSVSVAGDFNKWRTNADEMKRTDGGWSIDLKLKPGEYSYSFIVDGKSWVPDPGAEMYRDDGFGSRNAVMRVKSI